MIKVLCSLAAIIGGLLLTGCSKVAGRISTSYAGNEFSLEADGKGDVTAGVQNAVGGVEVSGHLGNRPAAPVATSSLTPPAKVLP